jgi:hypothetical protein
MYACISETGRGFFAEVCALSDQARNSSDPPYHWWIASCLYCLRLSRFLPLTAVNVYSLLHYPVLGNKLESRDRASFMWTSRNSPSTHSGE